MTADLGSAVSSKRYNQELFGLVHGSLDHPTERGQKRLQWIASHIPPDVRSILDVGSGPGFLSKLLAGQGFRVTSIDIVFDSLRRFAGSRAQADATKLPFADRSIDAVLCAEVVEHLSDSERAAAFREMWRVAKSYVVITVPYRERMEAALVRCDRCGATFHPWGHRATFDEDRLNVAFPSEPSAFRYMLRPTRCYHPALLQIRHQLLGAYGYDDLIKCPACHNDEIQPPRRTLAVRVLDRLDRWMGYQRDEGWVLAIYERSPATSA